MIENREIFAKICIFFGLIILICFFSCHANAQLKGFHYEANEKTREKIIADTKEAEQLGANFFRFQIITLMKNEKNTMYNREEYLRRVDIYLDILEDAIQHTNLWINVDLHDCPNAFFDICLAATEKIYERFKGYYRFLGNEINEPSVPNWLFYAQEQINLANRIAPDKLVFIQSFRGSPSTLNDLAVLKGKNWIPTFHFYHPFEITHQGVLQYKDKPYLYGKDFRKKNIEKKLEPVFKFIKKTKRIPIVTEFACVRWSGFPKFENCTAYIRDVIAIFNKNKIGWAYTGFRGNNVWTPFGAWNRNDTQEYPATWVLEEIKRGFI